MATTAFVLDAGDHNVGEAYLPDRRDGRLPVLIYCHGWNGNRELRPCTQALLDRCFPAGVGMVTFDFYGCGSTGGDYSRMTYGRWAANLEDVVDWVKEQEWADPSRVGCFAISSGTTAALRLAATTQKVCFVISVATALGLFIDMPNGPGRVLVDQWDELAGGGTAEVFGTRFTLDFFRDFIGRAPVYDLASITCPVFFLQGMLDNPWRRADAWLGCRVLEARGSPVRYRELPNGRHGLDEVADQCAEEVMAWLREINMVSRGPEGTIRVEGRQS
jgi:pimeloyl-ACP methyl ester carboxylesterase